MLFHFVFCEYFHNPLAHAWASLQVLSRVDSVGGHYKGSVQAVKLHTLLSIQGIIYVLVAVLVCQRASGLFMLALLTGLRQGSVDEEAVHTVQ